MDNITSGNLERHYAEKFEQIIMKQEPIYRNSSVELLRLLLMLLIVVHHGIVHGLGLTSLSAKFNSVILFEPTDHPFILLVNSLCIVGVNCFIIISGYYKITLSKKKFFYITSLCLFYTLILNVIPELCNKNYHEAIKHLMFLSHSSYWFVIDYIFLMFFAPLLNIMFEKMDQRYIAILLIAMTIMSVYFGFIWNHKVNDDGYSFFQFIFLYSIGRYLKKIKLSTVFAISIYLGCSTLTTMLMCILIKGGFHEMAWKMTYYNNPLIILSAIGLFFVFNNFSFYSRTINYIAKSALAIYLIQSSSSIAKLYYSLVADLWNNKYVNGGILLIICALSFLIVFLSLFADIIRRFIGNQINLFINAKSEEKLY